MLKINMRLKAIIVIISLALAIVAPLSFTINISDSGKVSVITTLDVCHAKGSMISAASDAPVIGESQCTVCGFYLAGFLKILNFHSKDIPVVFQKEQPPRL